LLRIIQSEHNLYEVNLFNDGAAPLCMVLLQNREKLAKYLIQHVYFDRVTNKAIEQNRNPYLIWILSYPNHKRPTDLRLLQKIVDELEH